MVAGDKMRVSFLLRLLPIFCIGVLLWSCTTPGKIEGERTLEELEDEKEPLSDEFCLDGEYLDKDTESCEPLESSGAEEDSHDGAIDVPVEDEYDRPEEELP